MIVAKAQVEKEGKQHNIEYRKAALNKQNLSTS